MVEVIRTIDELESLYYGTRNLQFIAKADAPLLGTTTGIFNAIFGAYAWVQLNLEANVFAVLPKYVWQRSGWRIITGRAVLNTTGGNTDVEGGTPEGGALAETAKPDVEEVNTSIRTMQLPFNVSEVLEFLATESQDDVWGGLGAMRLFMAVQHKEKMNIALTKLVTRNQTDTYAGTDSFETIDRGIANKAERDQFFNSSSDYWDIYGLDRDAQTKYDASVDFAAANRILTDELIVDHFADIRKAGGKTHSVTVTGHKTYAEMQKIFTSPTRYNPLGEATVGVDVNGISTFKGYGFGIHVSTLYDVPVIVSKEIGISQSGGIENIYNMDISDPEGLGYPRAGIMIARPTQYFEAGRQTAGWPFITGDFTEKGVYRTMGEIIFRHFVSQGKISDLKA